MTTPHDPLVCGINWPWQVPCCPGCLAELTPEQLQTLRALEAERMDILIKGRMLTEIAESKQGETP